jgi:hypothetical protein
VIFRRPSPSRTPARAPAGLHGPMSEQQIRELQRRLAEKRAAAIAELGERWLLHPANRIR